MVSANRAIRLTSRHTGQLALFGLLLLLLLTIALLIVRNRVENDIVQRAALDLPLLKNRWPQFKQAVRDIYPLISAALVDQGERSITTPLPEMLDKITSEQSREMVSPFGNSGRIVANVEVIYFDRNGVRPSSWYWSPMVDTSLTATELHTRLSWQQLTETELITAEGPVSGSITPTTLIDQRRAMVLFYIYTEWRDGQIPITILIRALQVVTALTVLFIAMWVFTLTQKIRYSLLVVVLSLLGLVIYSSLVLKALSLHTILAMLITLQFGPGANKAVDFAPLSTLLGAGYGLLLLGLVYLPARPGCPECGRTVSDEYRFCPYCNFVLKHKCARCAAPVDTRWNYCPNCSEDI